MTAEKSPKWSSAPAEKVRVAIAQTGSVLGDSQATLGHMQRSAEQAAARQAQIVVFPEAYIGGYPKGMDFGATVGIRTAEGRALFSEYSAQAIVQGDANFEAIADIARKNSIHLLTGLVEREGGTLYCGTALFSPEGTLLNYRRKLIPTAQERVIWGQGDGSGLEVVATPLGRIGSAICWENYMPLLRMALYSQHIELYFILTVDDRDLWQPTLRHIAREGRCFVISACQYLTRDQYPEHWLEHTRDLPQVPIRGGSCVIGPLGEYLQEPVYDREELIFIDLNPAELAAGRYDLDVAGHYHRPDLFSFDWKRG